MAGCNIIPEQWTCILEFCMPWNHLGTGKSLSEALIFASINP